MQHCDLHVVYISYIAFLLWGCFWSLLTSNINSVTSYEAGTNVYSSLSTDKLWPSPAPNEVDVVRAANVKITVVWNVRPSGLAESYHRFCWTWFLRLQDRKEICTEKRWWPERNRISFPQLPTARLTVLPIIFEEHVPPKRWKFSTRVHGVTSHNALPGKSITTAVQLTCTLISVQLVKTNYIEKGLR
jgi:hypothetical protein